MELNDNLKFKVLKKDNKMINGVEGIGGGLKKVASKENLLNVEGKKAGSNVVNGGNTSPRVREGSVVGVEVVGDTEKLLFKRNFEDGDENVDKGGGVGELDGKKEEIFSKERKVEQDAVLNTSVNKDDEISVPGDGTGNLVKGKEQDNLNLAKKILEDDETENVEEVECKEGQLKKFEEAIIALELRRDRCKQGGYCVAALLISILYNYHNLLIAISGGALLCLIYLFYNKYDQGVNDLSLAKINYETLPAEL